MTAAGDPQAELRILALGDSYTIGESVHESDRWPVRLAGMLRRAGVRAAEPQIVARTGWTTDELNAALDAAKPHGTFDLVTLLIGVNDQYRGRRVEEYRTEFRALLGRAIGYAGAEPSRVVVVAIPDWGVTPFARGRDTAKIGAEIEAFNAINREEASRAGTAYADVAAVSRQVTADGSLVARDGLHPSGTLYERWAEIILPIALQTLVH